jgi:hypothetical protein
MAGEQMDKKDFFTTRLAKLLTLAFASDKDPEAIAALRAARELLAQHGLDAHDVAARIAGVNKQLTFGEMFKGIWGEEEPDAHLNQVRACRLLEKSKCFLTAQQRRFLRAIAFPPRGPQRRYIEADHNEIQLITSQVGHCELLNEERARAEERKAKLKRQERANQRWWARAMTKAKREH